eukprot:gene6855-4298_t
MDFPAVKMAAMVTTLVTISTVPSWVVTSGRAMQPADATPHAVIAFVWAALTVATLAMVVNIPWDTANTVATAALAGAAAGKPSNFAPVIAIATAAIATHRHVLNTPRQRPAATGAPSVLSTVA